MLDSLLSDLDLDTDWSALPNMPDAPQIAIPDAPTMAALNLPVRPNVEIDATLPDAPSIALPEIPVLRELSLPDFEMPQLPDFDLTVMRLLWTA